MTCPPMPPPAISVIDAGARLSEIPAAGAATVRLKVALPALLTPLPPAQTVIVWAVTRSAPAEACSLMELVFPVPGSVMVALTPVGSPATLK